jgi:glycosyltransferase involved in cell wall biosynthesis
MGFDAALRDRRLNANCLELPGVTVIVPCKGRLSHLRQSAPRILRQRTSRSFTLVVVDYGDPDCCFEWVAEQKRPKFSAIRVCDDVDIFNLSRARNCGACVAVHELLAFVDADALLAEEWLDKAVAPILSEKVAVTIPDWPTPACGICVVRRSDFHRMRGFDESLRGWGHEDIDFIQRVSKLGAVARFDSGLVQMIQHSEELRVQFYANKDSRQSHIDNRAQASTRRGTVNPLRYGEGDFEIFKYPFNA